MIPEVVARVAHHGVYKRLIALDELHLDGLLAVDDFVVPSLFLLGYHFVIFPLSGG